MPHRNRRSKRGNLRLGAPESQSSSFSNRLVFKSTSFVGASAGGASAFSYPLNPNNSAFGGRQNSVCQLFQSFLVSKLRVTVFPLGSSSPVGLAAGITVGYDTTAITTLDEVLELPCSTLLTGGSTRPACFEVPTSVLRSGQRPKYKVVGATSPETVQGFYLMFVTGASNVYFKVDAEIIYFDPVIVAPTFSLQPSIVAYSDYDIKSDVEKPASASVAAISHSHSGGVSLPGLPKSGPVEVALLALKEALRMSVVPSSPAITEEFDDLDFGKSVRRSPG